MKRRSLTVLLCLLAIISLASVGFASWVISASDEKIATGNITVEEVEDERLEIKYLTFSSAKATYDYDAKTGTMPNFEFGILPSDEITNPWLTNPDLKEQVLKITVKFKVFEYGTTTEVKDLTENEISVVFEALDGLLSETKDDVINEYAKIKASKPKVEYKDGNYTFDLELEWGSYFSGQNPYTYYNSKKPNDPIEENSTITWADEAKTKLNTMYAALQKATFKVTITVTPKIA